MSAPLRDYQERMVDAAVDFFTKPKGKRGGLIVAPTGSGKAHVLAGTAERLDAPLLVFQPNREILMQNAEKLRACGIAPTIYSASMGRKDAGGDVVLATIGSVAARKGKGARESRAELFADFPYIIADEAHMCGAKEGQYKDFFAELGDARLCGLTATPFRLASNSYGSELRFLTRTRPRLFQEVIAWVQTGELFERGFLSKLEYYQIRGFDKSLVKLNSTGADYENKSLQRHLFKIGFTDKVVEVVGRVLKAGRRNVLVFVRYVKDAELIAGKIPGAVVVTANTPAGERDAIGKAFKSGEIQTVINCGVYLLGFDHPRLECVIDAAHSISLARVYQKWGRGARPHSDKESCWIVDMCGGYDLFGPIESLMLYCEGEAKWSLWGRPGGPDKKEVQLTNTPLSGGDMSGIRCKECLSPAVFWSRHITTTRSALLCRPPDGIKPNIALVKVGEVTRYDIVGVGHPESEFVQHRVVCVGRKAA